jgi:hypothetical protein
VALFIHQLLLLAAIAALVAAGWRLASLAVASGLLRVLATVVLAAGAAVLSALALGLARLGASPVALTVAATAIWGAAWRWVPGRPPSAWNQLSSWWRGLSLPGRVARGALAGAALGYGAFVLRHPGLGLDALTYHLALPVAWVHNGRPGSLVPVNDGLQIQNYPLTWEVLVAWVTAIARTLVPATLLTPATFLLLGTSIRAGLRECGVSARISWLTTATVTTLPLVVVQLPGPNNDLPEIAWLAGAAALVAGAAGWRSDGAERNCALLPVALVAVGLCVGTKTTGAALAALVLVLGGWRCRDQLRALAPKLALAAAAAAAIGGVWYVRNLIDHGAPFWPLSTTPWGDPVPQAFRAFDASFLSHVHVMLHRRTDAYWKVLAGGVVMGAAAILSPLWARGKTRWGGVVVLAALVLWAASPYTGISSSIPLALGATRYLLPCLLAAGVTLALAARRGSGFAEVLSASALLGALVVNLFHDADLTFPTAPSMKSLLIAAALGAVLVLAAEGAARAGVLTARLIKWIALPVAVAMALVALLAPVNGYVAAHAEAGLYDAGLVRWFNSRAAFRHGSEPVLIGPVTVAVLTGARLAHPVLLLSPGVRCPVLVREARDAWVVLEVGPDALADDRHWIICLGGKRPAYLADGFAVYAPPALAAAS